MAMDAREAVRWVIQQSGMKQRAVAAKAGLTEQQMCDVVNMRRKLDANELFAICQAVGVTPDAVFEYCQMSK